MPDTLHPVLADHGRQCTHRKRDHSAFCPLFDRSRPEPGLDHRLTNTNHPWTNGPVARMNRTLKEATVRTYDSQTHQHFLEHRHAFMEPDGVPGGSAG